MMGSSDDTKAVAACLGFRLGEVYRRIVHVDVAQSLYRHDVLRKVKIVANSADSIR